MTTVAGVGGSGFFGGGYWGDGETATGAQLYQPSGLAVGHFGEIYVGDRYNHRIRKLTPAAPDAPVATSVSAATYAAGKIARLSIASLFGPRLATATQAAAGLPLPTSLGGTRVIVRDSAGVERHAPLFYVSPTQINYLVPPGTASGAAGVTVISADGQLSTGTAQVAATAPGLFTANADGRGVVAALVHRVRADGAHVYEDVAARDPASGRFVARPIDLGPDGDHVFLELYGTGVRYRSFESSVRVSIGGLSAEVLYSGPQGGYVGLDQVNVRLPRSLAGRGEVDLVLTVDGKAANTVKVSIR
jgi:uncharacterized protein (TIGR03437 family)